MSGFSRVGTICLNDTHLAFNFTIAANSSTILKSIENITLGIEQLLNETQLFDSSVVYIAWVQNTPDNESIVEGYVSPFKGSQSNAESAFSNSLLAGGVPGSLFKVSNI